MGVSTGRTTSVLVSGGPTMSQTHKLTNAAVDVERDTIVVSIFGEMDTIREVEIVDAVVALDAPPG